MKLIPNARRIASRSYAFLFSAASAFVGVAAVAQQLAPAIMPALPPGAAAGVAATLAAAAAVGRVIDQGLIPRPEPEPGEGGQ